MKNTHLMRVLISAAVMVSVACVIPACVLAGEQTDTVSGDMAGQNDTVSGGNAGQTDTGSTDTGSSDAAPAVTYVTEVEGVPVIVAKQKVDISGEFLASGPVKKYVVEPAGYAKVTKKGILMGKLPGKIKITAYDQSGSSIGSIERVVFQPRLSPMVATHKGEVIYAEQFLTGDAGYLVKPTRWEINKRLAVIDPETGRITVGSDGKHGKATVTAVYGDGKGAAKYKADLSVDLPYLSMTKLTLEEGDYKKLKLKNAPAGVTLIWSSSKEKVATVNDNGRVKAKNEGKCVISVRAGDDEFTCKVTVEEER